MGHPICSILLILLLGTEVSAQDVDTTHGRVSGQRISVLGQTVDVYYGIPFAKPPIGDLRFKHPQPADHWRPEAKDARAMKPSCQQQISGSYGMPLRATPPLMSEDCLYMNIWAPANVSAGTRLATMVWIYGGSFTGGSINIPLHDGKYLAAENNVIVISINYRLGAHGFLYLGPDTFPGNQGMMDQVLALKWIYENAERFGGDQNNITIFGESAGAASVGHHLLSPLSRDFFTRAILQSGTPQATWAFQTPSAGRRSAMALAGLTNCSGRSDAEIFECIKKLPPGEVIESQGKIVSAQLPFGPVVDGYFLPDSPNTLLMKGSVKQCDILLGVNKDEGTLFLSGSLPALFPPSEQISVSRTQFLAATNIFSMTFEGSETVAQALVAQYEATQVASLRDNYADIADDIFSDSTFKCPAGKLANMISRWSNVYLYSFEHMISSLPLPKWMGVPHTFEIEMVFGHPLGNILTSTQKEKDLSRTIMTYWTNFAKTGNPNLPTRAISEWPRYNTTDERFLVLDLPERQTVQQGLRKQECVFFNILLPMIIQNSPEQPATTTETIIYPCVNSSSKVKVISWILLMSMIPAFILLLD